MIAFIEFGQLASLLGKGLILTLIGVAVSLLMRREAAGVLYYFWRSLVVALCLLSLVSFGPALTTITLPKKRVAEETVSPPRGEQSAVNVSSANSEFETVAAALPEKKVRDWKKEVSRVLVAVWLGGLFFVLGRWLVGCIRARQLIRESQAFVDADWQGTLIECSQEVGVSQSVKMFLHPTLHCPMVIGWLRPTIVIPEGNRHFGEGERRMILLHELIHIKRRDSFFHPLLAIVKAVHWPNPLLWFAVKSYQTAEERAVDDCIISHGVVPSTYSELLMSVALPKQRRTYSVASAMAQSPSIETRVQTLLNPKQKRKPIQPIMKTIITSLTVTAALLLGAVRTAFAEEPPAVGDVVVVIDPGHGGHDPGAIIDGIVEKDLNYAVAQKLKKELEKSGAMVVFTRWQDDYVSLSNRVDISNTRETDCFISLHVNSDSNEDKSGMEIFSLKDKPLSSQLSRALAKSLKQMDGQLPLEEKKAKFAVLSPLESAGVLVELGFLSNKEEREETSDGCLPKSGGESLECRDS